MATYRLAEQGGAPIDLPPVLRGPGRARSPVGGIRATLGGAEVSQISRWRRVWTLDFGIVTDATVAVLELWITPQPVGHGPGPHQLYEADNPTPYLVNVAAFDPRPDIAGYQRLSMTLREVLP